MKVKIVPPEEPQDGVCIRFDAEDAIESEGISAFNVAFRTSRSARIVSVERPGGRFRSFTLLVTPER